MSSGMFNAEQQAYIDYLHVQPPETLCWCGWYKLGECPNGCPPDKSSADKMMLWCPGCHNAPLHNDLNRSIVHRIGCKKTKEKP